MKNKKTAVYLADFNRQKLSNRTGWVDLTKKGELQKYIKAELEFFPEAVWVKVHGFDFSPISNFLKK